MATRQINATDAAALLRRQDIKEIIQMAPKSSAALSTFRTLRLSAKSATMPVLAALPTAGWVGVTPDPISGSTGVKPLSNVAWASKTITAEEIAVIVPVHEDLFDDTEFNIWEEVKPLVAQEFGRILDLAVFFGTNAPATFDDSLVEGARAAGNVVSPGTIDLAEDVNQVMSLVEADGFDVNQFYAKRTLRGRLRGLRDDVGQPIYLNSIRSDGQVNTLYGEDLAWVTNGGWVAGSGTEPSATGATLIGGDRDMAILGIRQDMQVKVLDQATVGTYNLAERDMIALRFKFRVGFAVANPLTPEASGGYPFAILGQPSA
jgi:HK97 family phage major capsid protein